MENKSYIVQTHNQIEIGKNQDDINQISFLNLFLSNGLFKNLNI